jgi:hypothetical protein
MKLFLYTWDSINKTGIVPSSEHQCDRCDSPTNEQVQTPNREIETNYVYLDNISGPNYPNGDVLQGMDDEIDDQSLLEIVGDLCQP